MPLGKEDLKNLYKTGVSVKAYKWADGVKSAIEHNSYAAGLRRQFGRDVRPEIANAWREKLEAAVRADKYRSVVTADETAEKYATNYFRRMFGA
ncbi:MAG: hypothetical protein JZD41_02360 [Thermoproteus sp.]|nr:hypothetical protein [Thermoproteus sp.]